MNENYDINVSLRRFDILRTSQLRNSNLLPIGQHCNVDYFVGNNIQYYNFGECYTQIIYCGGFGWKLENKGSACSPDFGRLCCGKIRVLLPPFPRLPDDLNAFLKQLQLCYQKKILFQKYTEI